MWQICDSLPVVLMLFYLNCALSLLVATLGTLNLSVQAVWRIFLSFVLKRAGCEKRLEGTWFTVCVRFINNSPTYSMCFKLGVLLQYVHVWILNSLIGGLSPPCGQCVALHLNFSVK